MDAQTFLAEFGHIANASDGVSRLKDLILHLAVSGDLVHENAPVNAAPLIDSINARKRSHPERKKVVAKQEPVPPHTIKVPHHWAVCRLGDLTLTITGGGTPSKNYPAYWDGKIPWASVKDLKELKYLDDTEDHITQEGLTNSSSNLIPANRIIVCTRMGLGKIAINRVAMAINQDLKAFELPPEVNSEFFLILYKTREVKGTGTTVAGIKQDQLLELPAALPPIEEQYRIVTKVDELMAMCDKLKIQQQARSKLQNALRQSLLQAIAAVNSPQELHATWTRLDKNFELLFSMPENLADLRRAIQDLAVSGFLSKFEKSDDNAADLLDRILVAKKKGITEGSMASKKHVKPEKLKESSFPAHWASITLDDAISTIDAGWSPECLPSARDDESKWGILKTTSVQTLRFLPQEHKELPASLDPKPQFQIELGDILLTRAGPKNRVGICCVVDRAPPRLMISDKLIRFHIVNDLIDARFVALCLSAGESGRILERLKSGMADSQMNISQDKLRTITIPLPSIAEQRRILVKVDGIMRMIEALETRLSKKVEMSSRFGSAAIAKLTGISIEQEENGRVKAPQTELIAPLRSGSTPNIKAQAPLATILARHSGEMSAKDLWQRFGGEIDTFYGQLKTEVAHGWILEPTLAKMREIHADEANA
jgi:type I restriction enzyme, S subunit